MSCCGQKRAALRAGSIPAAAGSMAGSRVVPAPSASEVRLRWRRVVNSQISGPVTGRLYDVSANRRVVVVDRRDAPRLLQTGFFGIA